MIFQGYVATKVDCDRKASDTDLTELK